jgi:meso-butanediol dehydrogenase / (S,S)-butanediol dehydrogenase / diacetyl reductase
VSTSDGSRVALVTGAGRGIGREIADSLAAAGYRLALCSRTGTAVDAASEITALGTEAFGARVDVSRPAEVRGFVDSTLNRFGRLDALVSNAGVNYSGSVLNMTQDRFDEIFATNVRGVFFGVQAVAPAMIAQRAGTIVNIASFVARTPVTLFTAYSASKAAVVALTRGLALELAEHDINVNAVCPGNVRTQIWESSTEDLRPATGLTAQQFFDQTIEKQPFRRPQTGAEIGAAVVFLCSAAARNITGEALYVSGGM